MFNGTEKGEGGWEKGELHVAGTRDPIGGIRLTGRGIRAGACALGSLPIAYIRDGGRPLSRLSVKSKREEEIRGNIRAPALEEH